MGKIGLFFALLAFSGAAGAQSVYKCRDAKGGAVYQSTPCPEAEKRWDTQPRDYTWDDHYKREAADRKIAADRRHMRARAGEISAGAVPVGTTIGTRNASACEAAKRHRQAVYDAAGLKRDFALSRAMDNAVHDACK